MEKLFILSMLVLCQLLVIKHVLCLPLADDVDPNDEVADDETLEDFNTNQVAQQFKGLIGNDDYDDDYDDDEDDDDDDRDFCPICYNDYLKKPPFELKCGHIFHLDCLEHFQVISRVQLRNCFICSKPLRTKDDKQVAELLQAKERAVVRLKLKIGYMAGYGHKPVDWENLSSEYWKMGPYFYAFNEDELATQRDFE